MRDCSENLLYKLSLNIKYEKLQWKFIQQIEFKTLFMCQVEIWIWNRNLDLESKFGSEIQIWIRNWIKLWIRNKNFDQKLKVQLRLLIEISISDPHLDF